MRIKFKTRKKTHNILSNQSVQTPKEHN